MDIIFINKTMTKESKQTKNKTFVFVLFVCFVALKRAVFNGSTKSRFIISLELFMRGRIKDVCPKMFYLVDFLQTSPADRQ